MLPISSNLVLRCHFLNLACKDFNLNSANLIRRGTFWGVNKQKDVGTIY